MTNGRRRMRLGGTLTVGLLLAVAAALWLALDPGFRSGGRDASGASDAPKAEFDRKVRDALLRNPQVVAEAIELLQARRRAAQSTEAVATLKARAEEVFHDPASPVGGNPEGDVTLVEFFDYNCPYCRGVAPVMVQAEAADPRLRIVYKEFPILGPDSLFTAKAALAAHRQGRYVAFHKALMRMKGPANAGSVLAVAAEMGLDVARLKSDMKDPAIQKSIDRNLALARALRITGTPGFVAGEGILRGATDLKTLQAFIGRARDER